MTASGPTDNTHQELDEMRQKIDLLDGQMLAILAERRRIVLEIGRYKQAHQLPPFDQARWQIMLAGYRQRAATLGLSVEIVERMFTLIHEYSLTLEVQTSSDA